ncbi:MAG: peptidase M23, partial [Chitinophagaceae bacterium]
MTNILFKYQELYHPVVDFEPGNDTLFPFDFTFANKDLDAAIVSDTN